MLPPLGIAKGCFGKKINIFEGFNTAIPQLKLNPEILESEYFTAAEPNTSTAELVAETPGNSQVQSPWKLVESD